MVEWKKKKQTGKNMDALYLHSVDMPIMFFSFCTFIHSREADIFLDKMSKCQGIRGPFDRSYRMSPT